MVRSGKSGGLHLKQIAYYKRTGEYHPTTLSSERSGIRRAAKKFVFKGLCLPVLPSGKEYNHNSTQNTPYQSEGSMDSSHYRPSGTFQCYQQKPQTDHINARTCKTIKAFLNKYCINHPNDWDEHLSAIAYAFNLTDLEPDQATPYFQMFNRNPHVAEPMNICAEGEYSVFAKILEATKTASQALEEEKTSDCQVEKNASDEQKIRNKIAVKRKPKQLNTLRLKVGHEVLRQRKNWWKDGRFQSEWVGPCIIDYITDNGCAILRDVTGSRLKRPIKMSHLKPYIRASSEKDNHYFLQGAVVVDHDYIGLSERPYNPGQQGSVVEGEINTYARDVMSAVQMPPAACKDQESTDGKHQSELTEDHYIESNAAKTEQWPSPCFTLQTKTEDT
ncbi:gypsy retrotransposon integrase-like protein 1 isoform 8-T11 [Amazona ochrocephala]